MKLDRSDPRRHRFQFSIKAVMILTLAAASFAAGKLSEQSRAREAERGARDQAEQARMVAEKSFRQAQVAVQQTRIKVKGLVFETETPQSRSAEDRQPSAETVPRVAKSPHVEAGADNKDCR